MTGAPGRRDRLTPLELAAGTVFGFDDSLPRLRPPTNAGSPRAVIDDVLVRALQRPPCVVSFSGGRDSSAVLALATSTARREGLPDPVPVSLTFPRSSTAGESDYQELVVRHLALSDWQRPTFNDELDIVGPLATEFLTRFGPRYPFNAYFHVPIMRLAAGGTVLTGIGGDELFGGWNWQRENCALTLRGRPLPLDPVRLLVSVGPRPLRRRFFDLRFRDESSPRTWLRPAARTRVRDQFIEAAARDTLSFTRTVGDALWRRRARLAGLRSLEDLAQEMQVSCVSPFYDADFVRAVMGQVGFRGFADRARAMRSFVGDLLPPTLLARASKASFADVFFTDRARGFGQQWTGDGVDDAIVDQVELRRVWALPDRIPDARTFLLMQSLWLAQHGAQSDPANESSTG